MSSFLAAHLLFWILPVVFEPWNAQTVDQLFLLRSSLERFRPPYDSTIVHVDISDKTLLRLKNSYQSRSEYARVVRNLADMGVAAQIWDFIFAARTNRIEDSLFIASTAKSHNVYLGFAFRLSDKQSGLRGTMDTSEYAKYLKRTSWNVKVEGNAGDLYEGIHPLLTFLELADHSKGLGYLNLNPDRDGVFRRAPLLVRYDGAFYPSIAFRAICEYLNVLPEQIILRPGKTITLKGAHRPGGSPRDIVIPVDKYGNMVINYTGPWKSELWQPMKHYDFAVVLFASDDQDEFAVWQEEMNGKIVVVSQVTTGSADVGPVPTDANFPKSSIHANVMHTILAENFLRELSTVEMIMLEILVMAIVCVLSWRLSSVALSLGIGALLVMYLMTSALCFLYANIILNIIRPSLMIVMALISIVAYRYLCEEKEKAVLRRSFESYFPPSIVKKIIATPEMITSTGQKKELTIMFSDIKGFTRYSANLPPDQIQKSLNEYFEAMTEIVFNYGGTVDKFIGDGLMVFFGDPEPQSDHAVRCVCAAIDMQKKVRDFRKRWESEGKMPVQVRIGINTGEVVVGNMGSARRLSYTVLGSDVNLAQRLEANAPVDGIMISQRTYDLVKDQVLARPLGQIQVKGFDQPITVYEVPVDGQLLP